MDRMARIAAIVINSVSRDARVLKEAATLARAGHEVTVFGIRDNNDATPETLLENGVRVVRVDWKVDGYLFARNASRAVGGSLALGLAAGGGAAAGPAARWARRFSLEDVLRAVAIAGGGAVAAGGWRASRYFEVGARRLRGVVPAAPSRRALTSPRQWALQVLRRTGRIMLQRRLTEEVAAYAPHVVHCHDLLTLPIGATVKRRTGAALLYDSHEIFEEVSQLTPRQRLRYRVMQGRFSRFVDGFVTVNTQIGRFLEQRYPALPAPVIVRNAVVCPDDDPRDDGRLRRAAAVEDGRRVLLYQGGFALYRGLEALVRSSPLLPEDWVLVMMGWGKLEAQLRRVAADVDTTGGRVRFLPGVPQAELRSWTAGADLGVIPYENVCLNHWYCSPNKLWEYPAAGVPILASPFPVMSELIQQHGVGLLLDDPVSPLGIARAVAGVTASDLSEMRARCSDFIAKDNWSLYEQPLVNVVEGLANRRASDRRRRRSFSSS